MQSLSKFIILSLSVLFLDQTVKFFAVNKTINLEFSENSGVLFGIHLNTGFVFIFFVVFLFVTIISFREINSLKNSVIAIMAFCLMFGGIISNLIDRILYGHIIDYINLFNLFSFNIADLAICFGALILGWKVLGDRK